MRAGNEGSFGNTLLFSFGYGFAGFTLAIHHFYPSETYEHDALSNWLLAPLGAFFGFVVATWVHELAHFFTARLLGGHVRKIQIGSGVLLGTFRIIGTRCDVHESLRSGAVWYHLTSSKNARMKLAAITGAAPLASIVLAGSLVALLFVIHPLAQTSMPFWYYLYPFLVGITVPSIVFLPGILIPFQYQYAGRLMDTDALHLLKIPGYSDQKIAEMVISAHDISELDNEIDLETTSLEEALSIATTAPHDARALSTAINFLRVTHDPRTLDYFQKLIELPLDPAKRTRSIDQYVTCCLEWNAVHSKPQEMDALSRELIEADSGNISVMGTRGSVLIDLGRIEEGKAMLKDVLIKTTSTIDKTYANIFLALAEKQQGNLELAREHAEKAAKIDPACPVLKRVSDLLSPLPGTEKAK